MATLPENLVFQAKLETRMHVVNVVKAMLVNTVWREKDLQTSGTRSFQEPLEMLYQISLLEHRADHAVELSIFSQKVVQYIYQYQGRCFD